MPHEYLASKTGCIDRFVGYGGLTGCGLYTPDIEISNELHATAFLINKILNHVKCELRSAVRDTVAYDKANAAQQADRKRHLQWLDAMAAKVSIKLIVDEKGTLNPGVSFRQLLPSVTTTFPNKSVVTTPQSASIGLGALLSADATRTENVDYYYNIRTDFLGGRKYANRPEECIETGGVLLDANLKIQDWLDGVTFPYYLPDNVDSTPPDVLTHEVAFVVVASGNVTPSWSLVQVSANTAGSLAAAGRTNTGDVIISIGPPKSTALTDAHNIAKTISGFNDSNKTPE